MVSRWPDSNRCRVPSMDAIGVHFTEILRTGSVSRLTNRAAKGGRWRSRAKAAVGLSFDSQHHLGRPPLDSRNQRARSAAAIGGHM